MLMRGTKCWLYKREMDEWVQRRSAEAFLESSRISDKAKAHGGQDAKCLSMLRSATARW